MTRSVAGCGGQGDGGDMDGGEELRPWRGKGYGTRTEEREEGNGAEAHCGLDGVDGGLGEGLESAGGEDDLRQPEMKTASMEVLQGLPRRVA